MTLPSPVRLTIPPAMHGDCGISQIAFASARVAPVFDLRPRARKSAAINHIRDFRIAAIFRVSDMAPSRVIQNITKP